MDIVRVLLLMAVLIGAGVVLILRLRAVLFHGKRPIQEVEEAICFNQQAINYIQQRQWIKAKLELLGPSQIEINDDDFEFYKRTFGATELYLHSNPLKLTSLAYYRIFKNANDNIRSLMLEYAYILDGNRQQFRRQNCLSAECIHPHIHILSPMALKTLYFPARHRRYAFTFTREPLTRFISGMTEVEFRASVGADTDGKPVSLPFKYPPGSIQRVQEFITFLVASGGGRALFQSVPGAEMAHIVPQIGTVVLGHRVEDDDFHIFRLEQFDHDWQVLVNQSQLFGLRELVRTRKAKEWVHHPSSADPLNTTLAAKSFFSYASTDAFNRFATNISDTARLPIPTSSDLQGKNVGEFPRIARQYLRAVCRIYLSDFMCLNYSLPADCHDLEKEFHDSGMDYRGKQLDASSLTSQREETWYDHLRNVLPRRYMEMIAAFVCLAAESPECDRHVIHGAVKETPEKHDEL